MTKRTFVSVGIALLLMLAGGLANIAHAGYSTGGPAPAGSCPGDKVCGWIDVVNVSDYGVPRYTSNGENFYNDGPTADHLCQMRGYDYYTYQAVGGRYDKCNNEVSVVWTGSDWRGFSCTSSKWLAQIYCAKAIPNAVPTISWSSSPSSAACNASYYVEASGHDGDGNMTAVSVDKDGTPFAYAGGGTGYDETSGNPTSDSGPKTVTFTAWSNDSRGAQSNTISHTVDIGSCTVTPPVVRGCTNPSASNYNPAASQDDGSCVAPSNNPIGWLDAVSCSAFTGWASDADNSSAAIDVHFYADGNFVGATNAGVYRSDVGPHGFSFGTPDSLKDGSIHTIYAYGINIAGGNNTALSGSGKTIQCVPTVVTPPAPSGYISVSPPNLPSDGGAVTVSWAVTNATSCTASNAWAGGKGTSGSESISVSQTSVFDLSCTGPGGTWNGSRSVAVNPPSTTCQDPSANNYRGSLPCSWNPVSTTCQDPGANNYGSPLPCAYNPSVTTCQDSGANNFKGSLPCTYNPVATTTPYSEASYGNGGNATSTGVGGNGNNGNNGGGGPVNAPGFTVTADKDITPIQFLGPLSATSTARRIDVNPVNGFSGQVTLSVVDIRGKDGASLSTSTVATYSFDNKPSSTNSSTVLTYNAGVGRYMGERGTIGSNFQVAFSKQVSQPFKVTIRGTSGALSSTFVLTVDPNPVDPNFKEI